MLSAGCRLNATAPRCLLIASPATDSGSLLTSSCDVMRILAMSVLLPPLQHAAASATSKTRCFLQGWHKYTTAITKLLHVFKGLMKEALARYVISGFLTAHAYYADTAIKRFDLSLGLSPSPMLIKAGRACHMSY